MIGGNVRRLREVTWCFVNLDFYDIAQVSVSDGEFEFFFITPEPAFFPKRGESIVFDALPKRERSFLLRLPRKGRQKSLLTGGGSR